MLEDIEDVLLRADLGTAHRTGTALYLAPTKALAHDQLRACHDLGLDGWRVTTLDELRHALDAARRETVSTLIDIKVLPKTMVHSYGSWWNVGVAQTALSERIRKVAEMINEKRAEARDY